MNDRGEIGAEKEKNGKIPKTHFPFPLSHSLREKEQREEGRNDSAVCVDHNEGEGRRKRMLVFVRCKLLFH